VCKKIESEFAKSLAQGATVSRPLPPAQHQEPTPQIELYTEQHEERFDKRAKEVNAGRAHLLPHRDTRWTYRDHGSNRNSGGVVPPSRERRMREPKLGPTQFKAEVEKLQREGRMPTLEAVLDAVASARTEYREKLLAARRGKKAK
jgi:hypothetical protein